MAATDNAGQTECPRVTARRDWARNWNGDTDGTPAISEEATTNYSVAADGSWAHQAAPDGTIYKELFANSGWQTGLTLITRLLNDEATVATPSIDRNR